MTEIPTGGPGIPSGAGEPGGGGWPGGPGALGGPGSGDWPASGGWPGRPPGAADEILVAFTEPAEQRRLTVLVRVILAIPHMIVLGALGIAAEVVALICWFAALFSGRLPDGLAEFQVGYLRWTTRFYAYLFLLTDVYPPFELGDAQYPVRLGAQPGALNRLAVLFRIILVIPAGIVSAVLGYGLSTLVMVVSWLIVLIAGRMPRSLHEALAAAVRYQARVTGYFLMLTARYPGGLFGDPGTAAFGMGPAGGSPAGYEVPGGYGSPAGYGQAPPGYGEAPGGYGEARAGYGQPGTGYGEAGPGQPGYAAGYGPPAAPVRWLGGDQPWRLVLSRPAKRLIVLFLVLGAILVVAGIAGAAATSGSNNVNRAEATISVEAAFARLSTTLSGFDSKVAACSGKLSCVKQVDRQMSVAFGTFARNVNGISMPSSASTSAADRVRSDANQASAGFLRLSAVTSAAQYNQVVASTGLEALLKRFDGDYQALGAALGVH